MTFPLFIVYLMWVLRIMEPEWFLYKLVGGPFYWIPTLLAPVLLVIALKNFSRKRLYWPLLVFTALNVVASVFAENTGFSRVGGKFLVHTLLLFMATLAVVDTPAKFMTLIKIFVLGFVWYGVQGVRTGRVYWHPLMGNEDSFGPLMVLGFGFGYYFARASQQRLWKVLGYAAAALGVIGVVSSIARGAALAAGATAVVVWLRSPHKIRALLIGAAGVIIAVVAILVIFPSGEYWEEMSTIAGGSESGTGQGRLVLWSLAIQGYLANPVFGVGAFNCGVWMADNVAFDLGRSQFSDPNQLYQIRAHNDYVTILCEEGTVGAIAFVAMLVDYLRRLFFLRSKAAVRAWQMAMGGIFDLRMLSLGLEAALVAYMTNAFFYNQLYVHWIWTLVTFAVVLEVLVRSLIARLRRQASRSAAHSAPRSNGEPVHRSRRIARIPSG